MRLKITLFLFINILWIHQMSAQCSGVNFEERNGIAILEMESKSGNGFNNESMSGASAGRGLAYRGTDRFGAPSGSGISYSVRITSPGTYRFIWRNRIGVIASSNANTEHNDAWLKITGGNVLFFGAKGNQNGRRVYPGGSGRTPTPNGASSGGWFKVYTNVINWNWDTYTSDFDGHFIYANFPSAGTYTIQINGRSNGHFIDRMVLYKEGSYSSSQARDLGRGQTNCSGGSTPPPPPPPPANNTPPTVSFSNISNGQSFATGSNITVGLSANDSDGRITQHQIRVNGTLVDTDGSSYSPHIITNATAGNYTIRATVTDNSGATASTTATISVGGGTTPPPPPPPPTSGNQAPSVSFTNLSNGQQVSVGSTVSVGLSASDSDGSVVTHQIYINGTLVDTDGVSYTPHPIVSIQPGTYTIRATVTDNDGATNSSSITITAGNGGTPPPPPPPTGGNAAPTVSFSNLSNGQQVAVGSTVSVGLTANDSDGSIVQYQIFVNGTLVDTDGTFYTPHPISSIQAGNYTIRAVVTDNDGATAEATVSISAGSGTPPPPTSGQISFSLINASTNGVIGSISNGSSFSSAQGINIRAIPPSNTRSVRMTLSGRQSLSWIENAAPYALFGDVNGNYLASNLASGSYTIRAIAYSGAGTTGSVVADTSVSFTVGNSSASGKAFAYPNPVKADGKVSIKLPAGGLGNYGYNVSNSTGVTIEEGQFNADAEKTSVDLQLPNVGRQSEGVYYLTIISSGSKQTIPIIRE